MHPRKAFTLIELLVVIAIIAILSVVVILTLNPAQLLMQSRDSDRLSDLATINTALGTYSAELSGGSGFSLGSSSITYISIPDPTATTTAGTDCTGIGFPTGSGFHCAASSTYRSVNGLGWIPVNFSAMSGGSPFSELPIDPTDATSTNLYYTYQTDGTTFKLRAVPESQNYLAQVGANPNMFTSGNNLALDGGTWVLVPGNSAFGTNNFWVMKYAAVCSNGEGTYENPSAENNGYNMYNNTMLACTPANGEQIASLPGGWQVARISQANAASYCNSIGAWLITNAEWQTMAWNAENVASNWSGGVVGSGTMANGNSNNSSAEPASSNDANPDYLTGFTTFAHQRTETLSNGSVVWDINGNLWEWTSNTITGTNEPYGSAGGFNEIQFTALTTYGTLSQALVGPANAAWNSSQNIGQIDSEGQTDGATYAISRGGSWGDLSYAGLEEMELNYAPTYTGSFYGGGFRCAR